MFLSLFLLLLTGIIGGANGAIVKYLVETNSPIIITFGRMILGLVILSFFLYKTSLIKSTFRNKYFYLTSLFFFGNAALYAFGIGSTSLIMGQLLYVPTSLIVAILAYFLLREKLNREKIIGLILAIIGLSILIIGSAKTSNILSFGTPLGNAIIGIAVLSWSAYTVLSRKLINKYSSSQITYINFFYASILSFILLPFFLKNNNTSDLVTISPGSFSLLLILAIMAVAFIWLYQILIKRTSAFISSLVLYFTPVTGSFFGIIFFGERLTPTFLLGAFLIIIAVFYSTSYHYLKRKKF